MDTFSFGLQLLPMKAYRMFALAFWAFGLLWLFCFLGRAVLSGPAHTRRIAVDWGQGPKGTARAFRRVFWHTNLVLWPFAFTSDDLKGCVLCECHDGFLHFGGPSALKNDGIQGCFLLMSLWIPSFLCPSALNNDGLKGYLLRMSLWIPSVLYGLQLSIMMALRLFVANVPMDSFRFVAFSSLQWWPWSCFCCKRPMDPFVFIAFSSLQRCP